MLDDMETHSFNRDSQLMFAVMRVGEDRARHRVIVRKLTARELVVDGNFDEKIGAPVALVLPNIGSVKGAVTWTAPHRFGVAIGS
jgi:hypothetical protein